MSRGLVLISLWAVSMENATHYLVVDVHGLRCVHVSVNIMNYMSTRELRGAGLELALEALLKNILSRVTWLRPWEVNRLSSACGRGFDFEAYLPVPEGHTICWSNVSKISAPVNSGVLRQQKELISVQTSSPGDVGCVPSSGRTM
jgi:hypothetical protein